MKNQIFILSTMCTDMIVGPQEESKKHCKFCTRMQDKKNTHECWIHTRYPKKFYKPAVILIKSHHQKTAYTSELLIVALHDLRTDVVKSI